MGRANTRTLLPLDRWAYHLSLEPRHFNQVFTSKAPARVCHQPTLQYAWQAADRVGREDIAQAIAQAESDIVGVLGFYPVPQWIEAEVVRTAQPNDSSLLHGSWLMNPRGLYLSVEAAFGMGISGGVRAETSLGSPAIAWSDPDGDGYKELATVAVATLATSPDEIRVYFPGHGGDDLWEIRPLRSVVIAAGVATIGIDRHLLVDPDLWEAIDASGVDGDVDANFVATVDVRRVYNDPSQQVQFQWERSPGQCDCGSTDCAMCSWATQWGCLQARAPRLGEWTYQPANWDAATETFVLADLAVGRKPERLRLWYLAGNRGSRVARPLVEMDPALEKLITIYSVTLLDRPICSCNNIQTFVERWTEDKALVSNEGARYQFNSLDPTLTNPWGTRAGAIWAWRQTERLALGRAVRY